MTKTEIKENLRAAGCPQDELNKLATSLMVSCAEEKSRILAKERSRILENLHKYEYELSCIDYLAYKMRKEK